MSSSAALETLEKRANERRETMLEESKKGSKERALS